MLVRLVALAAASLALAAACGDEVGDAVDLGNSAGQTRPDGTGLGSGPYAIADITVRYTNPEASIDRTYRISCQGDTATVSGDAIGVTDRVACTALADPAVVSRLIDGPPADQVCTEIYGGADVAEITGVLDNRRVEAKVDRTNGCGINDWDNVLTGILPPAAGADPGPPTSSPIEDPPLPTVPEGSHAATQVVERYVEAVASGDLAAAWGLLAQPSRDALGGFDNFVALRSGLAEGIGAWDHAEDRRMFAIPIDGTDGAWAVTLLGVVAQEGPPSLAAASMVVYTRAPDPAVSPFETPFDSAGFVSFAPPSGSVLAAGASLEVELPSTVGSVVAAIDGRVVAVEVIETGPRQQRVRVVPSEPLGSGPHAVTVITRGEGALSSVASAYQAG